MIKHDMLRHFVAVAETGSLAGAGARLGRSPSAVSMMVKQLQDSLGAPLFTSDRKSHLSPLGQFVLDQAKSEIAHLEATNRAIAKFAATGGGLIRVAAVPSVAGAVLPAALKAFAMKFPDVQIDLRDMDSGAVVRGVQDGAFDLGIATAPPSAVNVQRDVLCEDPFGVICAADHPLANAVTPLDWQQLDGHALITNPLALMLASSRLQDRLKHAPVTAHNTLSLLALVQAGIGVTVLPRMVVQMAWKPIAFVSVNDKDAFRQLDLLQPPNTQPSVAVKSLAACLKEAFLNIDDAATPS